MKYLVLIESWVELTYCIQKLNKKVNAWLKDGYELAGGVSIFVTNERYYAAQAVVKKQEEEE